MFIKDIRSRREVGLSSADIFGTRGFIRCERLNFGEKKFGFLKLMMCPHRQGGRVSADILRTRVEGWVNFFAILYGRL